MAEQRISDLQSENVKLRMALQLVSTKLGLSVEEILQQEASGAQALHISKKQRTSIEEEILHSPPLQIVPIEETIVL